jgi:hypothetical protein
MGRGKHCLGNEDRSLDKGVGLVGNLRQRGFSPVTPTHADITIVGAMAKERTKNWNVAATRADAA